MEQYIRPGHLTAAQTRQILDDISAVAVVTTLDAERAHRAAA
ncbi:hypothetical protein [Streptomyces shenzhenensis]|nr:hypothetical protein [Streptomyces shenzhenensis]